MSNTCFEKDSTCYTYVVMPRLGTNLQDVFIKRNASFTNMQIYSLGIQLVNIMEQIHTAGFVYNDLKLDNLMLDANVDNLFAFESNEDIFERCNVNIVDFGFMTPYIDNDSMEHIRKIVVDVYRGNFFFSSINHLKYHSTSRRDDMISLFYLLVFLLQKGAMPGLDEKLH